MHFCTDLRTITGMTDPRPLRVPISEAAKRGVSWVSETAAERRVVLTRFGRPTAVVDGAERLDDAVAKIDVAARAVTDHFADVAAERTSRHSLADVISKLGLDPEAVRARAQELRA